jgi:hypothetical protein
MGNERCAGGVSMDDPHSLAPAVVDTVPGQLDAIRRRLDNGDARMTKIEAALAENTEITRDIRDAVTAGKVVTKVIKWVGALAVAASAIYAGFYQLTHGGRLPHQ